MVALLSLGLGIGANTTVFSLVDAVLLRPLPFNESDRLLDLWTVNPKKTPEPSGASYPDLIDWTERNRAFSHLGGYYPLDFDLGGEAPERLTGACASVGFLPALEVRPILGRNFLPAEDKGTGQDMVILGYGLWRRRFSGAPDIVGRKVLLQGRPFTVVGVLPQGFDFPRDAEVLVPLSLLGWQNRSGRGLSVVGRLRPGVSREQASADMGSVARQLAKEYPGTNTGFEVRMAPLQERLTGDVRPSLLALLGAVSLVLLIACANLASLLLARNLARSREIAIRIALGAGRGRLARQMLTESLTLSVLGGLLGLFVAWGGLKLFLAFGPADVPRLHEVGFNNRALLYTAFLSLVTGLLFGSAPVASTWRSSPLAALRDGGRGNTTGAWHNRLRNILVIAEVTLAMSLLIGAGLFVRSLLRLTDVDPGFDVSRLLTVQISLPKAKYPDYPSQASFFNRLLPRVSSLPGVQAAGAVNVLPLTGFASSYSFHAEGRPLLSRAESPEVETRIVWPGYFHALGVPLLSGRTFTDADRQESPAVLIINQAMAKECFPGQDPLGRTVTLFQDSLPRRVVGVVGDIRSFGPALPPRPEIYVPFTSSLARPPLSLLVRTTVDPAAVAGSVRRAVAEIDNEQPAPKMLPMQEILSNSMAQPRFRTLLLAFFSAGALLLAAIGLYAVLAHSVRQLQHEIALRMALGATPRSIFAMVTRRALTFLTIGMALGLVGSVLLARALSSLLFGITPWDLTTFISTMLLLIAVGLAASYLPARNATRIQPIQVLR
jgi:putative ABC transport system permease protein